MTENTTDTTNTTDENKKSKINKIPNNHLKKIVKLYYVNKLSLPEIAKRYNVTPAAVYHRLQQMKKMGYVDPELEKERKKYNPLHLNFRWLRKRLKNKK